MAIDGVKHAIEAVHAQDVGKFVSKIKGKIGEDETVTSCEDKSALVCKTQIDYLPWPPQ